MPAIFPSVQTLIFAQPTGSGGGSVGIGANKLITAFKSPQGEIMTLQQPVTMNYVIVIMIVTVESESNNEAQATAKTS